MKTIVEKSAIYKGICIRLEWLEGGRYHASATRFGNPPLPDGFFQEMTSPAPCVYTGYINAESPDLIVIEHMARFAEYKGFRVVIDRKEGDMYHAKNCYGKSLPHGLLQMMEYPGKGEYEGYIHVDDTELVFID